MHVFRRIASVQIVEALAGVDSFAFTGFKLHTRFILDVGSYSNTVIDIAVQR